MISFGITTHNEGEELQQLLNQLIPYAQQHKSEIVVLDDYSTDELTNKLLDVYESDGTIKVERRHLNGNFAEHKNHLTDLCSGDYVFQLDADEYLHRFLLDNLNDLLEMNSHVDLICVPRINIVSGITKDDLWNWGWTQNEHGWIQFPDYQARIYKKAEHIRWHNKVHETIKGFETIGSLPAEEKFCIYHIKDIERQREQNKLYSSMMNE